MSDMELQAGRELDEKIDEILFNRTFSSFPRGRCYHNGNGWILAEKYSTTWNGMQLVVEEMQRRGWNVEITSDFPRYLAAFESEKHKFYYPVIRRTAPHAVCLAALKALEEESK